MSVEKRAPEIESDKGVMPITGGVTQAEFKCDICGQVFTNQLDLEMHSKSHKKVQERIEREGTTGVG